jgi:hypothetical protein
VESTAVTNHTIEFFDSRRLEVNVDTLDVTLHLSHKKLRDSTLRRRVLLIVSGRFHQRHKNVYLHLGLELILQDTIEFLHVMLQERVQ